MAISLIGNRTDIGKRGGQRSWQGPGSKAPVLQGFKLVQGQCTLEIRRSEGAFMCTVRLDYGHPRDLFLLESYYASTLGEAFSEGRAIMDGVEAATILIDNPKGITFRESVQALTHLGRRRPGGYHVNNRAHPSFAC